MSNKAKQYALPDYQSTTSDIDQYINAWRELARPVELALGLQLSGYDPEFNFRKGNPQGQGSTHVTLPVWFVRDLSNTLMGRT